MNSRYVLLAIFLFPFAAGAAQSNTYNSAMPPLGLPAEWFGCKTSSDCRIIQRGCGFSLTVNSSHKAEAEKYIDTNKLFPESCIATPRPFDGAACENGVCVGTYSR